MKIKQEAIAVDLGIWEKLARVNRSYSLKPIPTRRFMTTPMVFLIDRPLV